MKPESRAVGGAAVVVRDRESLSQGEGWQVSSLPSRIGGSYEYADGNVSDAGLRNAAEAGNESDERTKSSVHKSLRSPDLGTMAGMGF